jgi:hypothetical protein
MDKPQGWTAEWQAALANANLEVPCFRSGLSSYEFAELAGVKAGCVSNYAKQGIEAFKQRFGENCSFEVVGSRKRPFRRLYTFGQVITPSIYESPYPNTISSSEFASLHGLKSGSEHLAKLARRGHKKFRERFPGWDFLQTQQAGSSQVVRWYGRIKDIGEQAEEKLPEDNLTLSQFACLKELSEGGVRLAIKRGLEVFQQQFPGWSFYCHEQTVTFYRLGAELEKTFTVNQFAKFIGSSTSRISSLVNRGLLGETFPGWQVRLTGLKCPKWLIYQL